jgi:glucosamine-6-phosphate isomerase
MIVARKNSVALVVRESEESLSLEASQAVLLAMQGQKEPAICVASGDSPRGIYSRLAEWRQQEKLDISSWYFVGLDEWLGLDRNDPGSCRYLLDRQLFGPLGVKEERICFFDGRTADPETECARVEAFIRSRGGLSLAILGLGMNGHIGLNEPGSSPGTRAHVSLLQETTKQVAQKYFSEFGAPPPLTRGITLGLGTIREAKSLLLIASGKKKAAIVRECLEEPPNNLKPASLLLDHPQLSIYLDQGAASELSR